MTKNNYKLLFLLSIVFCIFFVSCGVSTGEVVKGQGNNVEKIDDVSDKNVEINEESYVGAKENIKNEELKVVFVKPGEVPIIEICPPPYEAHIPGEVMAEKRMGVPGDSYDNLYMPTFVEDSNEGMVIIFTNVPDVKVSLNSRFLGLSNVGIVGVTPRIYILGLSKEGYKDRDLWISIDENKKQFFIIDMEKVKEE